MDGFGERFASACEEPLAVRSPLMGIFKAMAEPSSFEDSVDAIKQDAAANRNGIDLEELLSNMESSCEFAKNKAAAGDTALPRDHIAVIVLYTCEFYCGSAVYKVINESLRDADRSKVKTVAPYIWHLMKALEKCPAFEGGKVYIGYKGRPPAGYAPGKTVGRWECAENKKRIFFYLRWFNPA